MKRDMDLIRQILQMIEADQRFDGSESIDLKIEGRSDKEISYHIALLTEAGMLRARNASNLDRTCWVPQRLTWQGHEFLDLARKDTVWQKARSIAAEGAGGVSIEIFTQLLKRLAAEAVGL